MIQITKQDNKYFLECRTSSDTRKYRIKEKAAVAILNNIPETIEQPWSYESLNKITQTFWFRAELNNAASHCLFAEERAIKNLMLKSIVKPQCLLDLEAARETLRKQESIVEEEENKVKNFLRDSFDLPKDTEIEFGTYECISSPIGQCVLSENDGFDCCIFCGEPEERK